MSISPEQNKYTYIINSIGGVEISGWVTDGNLDFNGQGVDLATYRETDPFRFENICFKRMCDQITENSEIAVGPHMIDYIFSNPQYYGLSGDIYTPRPDAIIFQQVNSHLEIATLGEFRYRTKSASLRKSRKVKGMEKFLNYLNANSRQVIRAMADLSDGFIPDLTLLNTGPEDIRIVFMSNIKTDFNNAILYKFPCSYRQVTVDFG